MQRVAPDARARVAQLLWHRAHVGRRRLFGHRRGDGGGRRGGVAELCARLARRAAHWTVLRGAGDGLPKGRRGVRLHRCGVSARALARDVGRSRAGRGRGGHGRNGRGRVRQLPFGFCESAGVAGGRGAARRGDGALRLRVARIDVGEHRLHAHRGRRTHALRRGRRGRAGLWCGAGDAAALRRDERRRAGLFRLPRFRGHRKSRGGNA